MSGWKFPFIYRLHSPNEFEITLRSDKMVNKWFVIFAKLNELTHPRLGIIVSKRVAPKAVQRNKIKRVVRECFRRYAISSVKADFVVRVNRKFGKNESQLVQKKLSEQLTAFGDMYDDKINHSMVNQGLPICNQPDVSSKL